MTDPCTILIPVLRRPHRVASLVQSIRESTVEPHTILFICTSGDSEEQEAVEQSKCQFLVLPGPHQPGDYARKMNYGYRMTKDPWLFLAADDLKFNPGWLTEAMKLGSDPRIGVIGTQDLGNLRVIRGLHSTHSLVRRSYVQRYGLYDDPSLMLYEGYYHNFIDDELVETAKARRAWAFASKSIVEHLHPDWRKGQYDDVYLIARNNFWKDKVMFKYRRRLWIDQLPFPK